MKVLVVASYGGHLVQGRLLTKEFINECEYATTKKLAGCHYVKDFNINSFWLLPFEIIRFIWILIKTNPKVVLSTGAAPGVAAMIAGKILRKRCIWFDSIANIRKLSLSCRICKTLGVECYTQWPNLSDLKVKYIGGLL